MVRIYKWRINPIQDYLFASLYLNIDISRKEVKMEINTVIRSILDGILLDAEDLMYLDFDIKKKNVYFRVKFNNIITALWFSGIFPKDSKYVMDCNEFVIDNIKYKFNKKTKKLSYNKIN